MTYEYLCTACGHAWEAEQSISAAPLTTCPSCHAESAKRQVSGGAGFILKGGGWYSDLYGSAPKKTGGDADTKASDSATKKDGASDTSTKGTDKGSSGSGSSGSGSTGGSTPTSGAASGSKAAGAPSDA
ncbi:MAG TPA: zinc ribbon domain-containing protein [Polyangiaceae bacterium]|jgi:putative FmdB family regulatory protein|nr:zinc ribbon domain-containing protein [Polyangiaceae bacterium]